MIAGNQRLLGLPIAAQLLSVLAFVPVVLIDRGGWAFDVAARDLAESDTRAVDLLKDHPSATIAIAIAGSVLGAAVVQAWLIGAFIRSVSDGSTIYWPGGATFVNLAGFYVIVDTVSLAVAALVGGGGDAGALYLPIALAFAWLTIYADYLIVLDRSPIWTAIVECTRLVRRRPGPTMSVFAAQFAIAIVTYGLFTDPLVTADRIFPPFLIAVFLVEALARYVADCALLAIVVDDRFKPRGSSDPAAG